MHSCFCVDPGNDGGSCTEDDLSGSDREEMPERKVSISSTYEEVDKASTMLHAYETPLVSSEYEVCVQFLCLFYSI